MSDGVEVLVLHGFTRQNTGSSVVDEHETEQVDGIWLAEFLVLGVDESVPPLLRVRAQDAVVLRVQSQVVLLDVLVQVVSAQDLRDLDKLVVVVTPLEERLLLENNAGEHGSSAPDIEGVVIVDIVD